MASFHRQLSSIERSLAAPPRNNGQPARVDPASRRTFDPGEPTSPPATSRLALRRRRQIFVGLLAGFFATLGCALWFGSSVTWLLHATVAALVICYVALLVRHHQRTAERVSKVRMLSSSPAAISTGRPQFARRPSVVVLTGGSAPSA